MKKLSILILVLFVCTAFAVPAVAKVKVCGKGAFFHYQI